jgi:large-conductance mechanosensitive channel
MDKLEDNINKEIDVLQEEKPPSNNILNYDFKSFLSDFGILELAIGTSIGLASKSYLDSISKSIIQPIMKRIFNIESFDDHIVNIFGIMFRPGLLFIDTLTFVLLIVFVYLIVSILLVPLIREVVHDKKIEEDKNKEIMLYNSLQNKNIYNELKKINKNLQYKYIH